MSFPLFKKYPPTDDSWFTTTPYKSKGALANVFNRLQSASNSFGGGLKVSSRILPSDIIIYYHFIVKLLIIGALEKKNSIKT